MSRVRPKEEPIDSVKASRSRGERRAYDVLYEAQQHWNNMDRFRRDRERNKRYNYGEQWKDLIEVDGCTMTEEEYIMKQGNVPLKNNLLRILVRDVLGVYRRQSKEPTCYARDRDEQRLGETMSILLQCNMDLNQMNELFARTMEEFLISGFMVHKKTYSWRGGELCREDCWTDYVNPGNFFIDSNMRDFRGWDVSCLGEVHDISFGTLCSQFAESAEDVRRLKEIYRYASNREYMTSFYAEKFGYSRPENHDFLFTSDPTRCRVIEVWRKETKERYRCHDWNSGDYYKIEIEDYDEMVGKVNADRIARGVAKGIPEEDIPLIDATWMVDEYWYYYYLTPFGDILREGETPYEHKSHPYVFKAYPFIDGEIHSFVADMIDQQRYINRLITLHDFILKASAKGVLLFPEGCEPDGMSMEEVMEEWSRFDGIIMYKPKPGVAAPQQVANNSTQIGITELLNLQLKLMEEISGVNGALQGKPGYAGQSAAMYNQQVQNATTSLVDLMESYSNFVKAGALKDVKNMQQFYEDKRKFNIVGKNAMVEYDKETMGDVDFDLAIVESTDTPAFRQLANEALEKFWAAGAISLEQLLEQADYPFADDLLQSIRSQQEQIARGETPDGLSPALRQQVEEGADMAAVDKAYNMLMPHSMPVPQPLG